MHADVAIQRGASLQGFRCGPLAADQLHQRQQVHRVERMPDAQPRGMLQSFLQQRRAQSRGGGRQRHFGRQQGVGVAQHAAFQLCVFGRALLHEFGLRAGGLQRVGIGDRRGLGHRVQHRPGAFGAGNGLRGSLAGLGVRVIQAHGVSGQGEARRPARADHAAAEAGDAGHAAGRFSFSRVSAADSRRNPAVSSSCLAAETSCALSASTPFFR